MSYTGGKRQSSLISRRRVIQKGIALTGTVGISGLSSPAVAQSTKTQLRIGLITPPPHQWNRTADLVSEDLKSATNGDIELVQFPSGQLGSESQMLQLLQIGAIDFAFLTTSEFANRLSGFGAFYTPYIVKTARQSAQLLAGSVSQKILGQVSRIGLHGLGFGMAGMRQIVSRQSVTDIDGLRGRKVRVVPDLPLIDFWRLAHTAPTPIPLSSLYDAFANGQVDAMHIDYENTLKQKFYTHARTVVASNHMIFPMVAVASERSWAGFSEDTRTLIVEIMQARLRELRFRYIELDQTFRSDLIAADVKVLDVDESFFEGAAGAWETKWSSLTSYVDQLKTEADALSQDGFG